MNFQDIISEECEPWMESYPKITKIINDNNYKIIVEIGVAYGGHSNFILKNTKIEKLYGIDPYLKYVDYIDPMNISQEKFDSLYEFTINRLSIYGNRYEHIRKFSNEAIFNFDENSVDLVYIDGNHGIDFVRRDLYQWWDIIKNGGIISGHDYNHPSFGVTSEVDDFAKNVNRKVIYLGEHVWYIEKK